MPPVRSDLEKFDRIHIRMYGGWGGEGMHTDIRHLPRASAASSGRRFLIM
jgi:hypothetical protein